MGIDSESRRRAHMSNVSLAGLISMLRNDNTNTDSSNFVTVHIDFSWLHTNKSDSYESIKHRANKCINIRSVLAKYG